MKGASYQGTASAGPQMPQKTSSEANKAHRKVGLLAFPTRRPVLKGRGVARNRDRGDRVATQFRVGMRNGRDRQLRNWSPDASHSRNTVRPFSHPRGTFVFCSPFRGFRHRMLA